MFQLNEPVASPVTVTWPLVLGRRLCSHLIEYCLVWADEAPLDHLLPAPWVHDGVTHVEQLTLVGHVRVVAIHPALGKCGSSPLFKQTQIVTSQLKSSTMFLRIVSASEIRPRELCCEKRSQKQVEKVSMYEERFKASFNLNVNSNLSLLDLVFRNQSKLSDVHQISNLFTNTLNCKN